MVFTKKDFNFILFYDLFAKILIKNIKLNEALLEPLNIFKWNKSITIINCKGMIFIINIDNFQIIEILSNDNINNVRKIKFKEYGECLLNF